MRIKHYQIISFLSSVTIISGLFMPMVYIPFIGEQTFYENQKINSYFIIFLAILLPALAFTKEKFSPWILAVFISAVFVYSYFEIQQKISEFEQMMGNGIITMFFQKMMESLKASVKIKIGVLILICGNLLGYLAAFLKQLKPTGE